MPVPLAQLLADAPYLAELYARHGDWLGAALRAPDEALAGLLTSLGGEDVSLCLRLAKQRLALLAAAAETGGRWTTQQATAALSDFADAALDAALTVPLGRALGRGELTGADPATSGLAIFALGKHGGRELNYSSDIDIVAFFDPARSPLRERSEATRTFTRVVQRLAALMQDHAEGGYVFRTDLRLRPDPGATPLALSVEAALTYYEGRGQNWERAAWIKARPAAGDRAVGSAFLRELSPYVWRRHLDFATIADIQAMKRQINLVKNVGAARVEGHNVKLGPGGIREIEFFTQTQQLIAGGRDPSLRARPTADALGALAAAGWITTRAAGELTESYWLLRAVENRLQMRRDEQTHALPEDEAGVETIARMMGEPSRAAFAEKYLSALATVARHYGRLFTEGRTLSAREGNLVFTGSDDDPETLGTLRNLGFADPAGASATIRKWHYGGYAATRAAAARAHLTELLPALLRTIADAGNADEALARFDNFLSRLPGGVQLFALLRTHEQLRALLVSLMASAPRMAEAVIHRAHVMDALIDPAFADEVTRPAALVAKVDAFVGEARDYQEVIDRARIIGQEQMFLIGAGLLSGTITPARAAEQYTALAETLLGRLFSAVREEFARRHGRVPGAQVALLAFGKMASREMTATSDLDFILIYDAGAEESDGTRPLATSHYFARLTQRLVAALSAPTAEGVLYHADMRLRPSGNAGPLATSLGGFLAYQREQAWTWEHLALTRARVVVADGEVGRSVQSGIDAVLSVPRDPGRVVADVLHMRGLLARERPPRHPFDLKLAPGGLIDLEFIAQSGQLVARAAIAAPRAPTATVLRRMGEAGLVPPRLADIHTLYSAILQIMSAALLEPLRESGWTDAFGDLLAGLTNYPTFDRLRDDLTAMQGEVKAAAGEWYAKGARV